jgi:hypothetical protein
MTLLWPLAKLQVVKAHWPALPGVIWRQSLDARCAECASPLQIFMVSSSKIQARGYETLYQFATANERSLFGRVVLRAPMRLRVTICSDFTAQHDRLLYMAA